MKRYTFGKAFNLTYSYDTLSAPSADAPSIAIYKERPSKVNARALTGDDKVTANITSWTDGSVTNTKTIAIPAIDNPDLDDVEDTYYAVINYTIDASEQSHLVIMPFLIYNPVGTISGHELVIQDFIDIFPTISDYISDAVLTKYLTQAKNMMSMDLKKKGIRFDQVINQNDLKYAISLKAIALSSYSEFKIDNDQFHIRYKDYEKMYQSELDSIRVLVDTDNDGAVNQVETKKIFYSFNNAR